MSENDIHLSLVKKLGYRTSSPLLHRILKLVLTSEDSELMLMLPATLDELADNLRLDSGTLEAQLQHQGCRGGSACCDRARSVHQ